MGGWGVWLPWTPCSKTCGPGERQRYRECNNPLPQFGGACLGDSFRVEGCDIGNCPRISSGTWNTWSSWTPCSATCGGGQRERQRARQRFSGTVAGQSSIPLNPENAPGTGSQETLDCNSQPCPVDGSWAEWGEWSRCSVPCGLGRRVRDRTCTDPSPVFGGRACSGPGTDLAHCFAGPCKDAEDRAVYLGTTSWIRFAPHNRPARFLVIYLHFKPIGSVGSLLRRYRQCRSIFDDEDGDDDKEALDNADDQKNRDEDRRADEDDKCQLVVDLSLEQAELKLMVLARGARLDIQSPVALSLGSWHEILVEVLKTGASLRVNNHERLYSNFSRPLIKDLDFDSYMVIGAANNKTIGFVGSISSLSINFKPQDLYSSTDWEGQGTPVGRHSISVQSINPSVQLPHFHGLYYSPVRLYHTEHLSVRVTLALDQGEGLLLYSPGEAEGTLMSLGLKQSRFVLCMVCTRGVGNQCHHGDLLRLHQWYHVSLTMGDKDAELRVDQGKALQLTCKGLPFKPRKVLFVGGRSSTMWEKVQKATNFTESFHGVLGTLVVNGRTLSFRKAVLMGRDDRLNPDGYSRASRITPVFEHKASIVMLHCEVDQPPDPSTEVRVIWLQSDAVLEPTESVEIVKPVGLTRRVGTMELKPGGHTEGIYACVVSRDGRLELNHIFPVFRHATRQDLYEGRVEWVFLKLLLVLLPLLALCCIVYKFRHAFIKLWNKWFGKKESPPEKEREPLLFTEPMDIFKPEQPYLQASDTQGSWDNYLAQKEGAMEKVDVVSFDPPEPRQLSQTPGVSTDRPVTVTKFGQVKLGEMPRVSSTIQYEPQSEDEKQSVDVTPVNMAFHNSSMPRANDPVYANLTHNKPSVVTCLQQHPLSYTLPSRHPTKHARKGGQGTASHREPGQRSRRGTRTRPQKVDSRLLKSRRQSASSERPPTRSEGSPPHAAFRQTKTVRRRCGSGDRPGRESSPPQGHGRPRGSFTSTSRERTPRPGPVSTNFPYAKTPGGRSQSEDRSHVVKKSDTLCQSSPPFDIREYQRLRVRVPEPVVYRRHHQDDVGSMAKHRSYHDRRTCDTSDDDEDEDDSGVARKRHRPDLREMRRRH